jgi:hypothetical protein
VFSPPLPVFSPPLPLSPKPSSTDTAMGVFDCDGILRARFNVNHAA